MTGLVSYHAGLAAEAAVETWYARRGNTIAARRWRGTGGEIDLVTRDGAAVIFVEVKKSRDFARAKEHLSRKQYERIWATANEFLAGEPMGLSTEVRLDLALVDVTGRIEIVENVIFD
jgi:putative endonuclease